MIVSHNDGIRLLVHQQNDGLQKQFLYEYFCGKKKQKIDVAHIDPPNEALRPSYSFLEVLLPKNRRVYCIFVHETKEPKIKKGVAALNVTALGNFAYVLPENFSSLKTKKFQLEYLQKANAPITYILPIKHNLVRMRAKILTVKEICNNVTKEKLYLFDAYIDDEFSIEVMMNKISVQGIPAPNSYLEGDFSLSING